MSHQVSISDNIQEIQRELAKAGYFHLAALQNGPGPGAAEIPVITQMERILKRANETRTDMRNMARFLKERVIREIVNLQRIAREPEDFDALRPFLERLLAEAAGFREEKELVPCYAEILSAYINTLYRTGSPGRESLIIKMMLRNISRRKAIEFDRTWLNKSFEKLEKTITVALIAKRYAVYVLATRGFKVIFRSEVDFRTFGTSPEALALQVTNILQKSGVKLSEVTDVVCGGGDLGQVPDGIYVLTEHVRDESWKRLHNST